MQFVIIAGGKGTRLKDRLGDLPKPMVDVGGVPLLEHHILLAKRHGFDDILLLTGYGAEHIERFCGNGSRWGVRVWYQREETPLGTAGAVLAALERLDNRFIVAYGDTMLNVDLGRFWGAHEQNRAEATLFLHPNDHPSDSDLVEIADGGRVTAFHPYPHPPDIYLPNLVNAALYVCEREALRPWREKHGLPDFGKHLFPAMVAARSHLHGYCSPEYIKDAGTPSRLDKVIADYQSGRIARGSFETPAPAVFVDRDGTLNEEVNRVKCPDELRLIADVPDAIARLNRSEYRVVVVSNQPVVARGDCDEAGLRAIHNKLETLLGERHAYLDAIYCCPHHPDRGFENERPELKIDCVCRKPKTGLIDRARSEMNLDLKRSWMIGDTTVDVQLARNAGVRSVLVRTGHGGLDARHPVTPDHVFDTFSDAVDFVLGQESNPDFKSK